MKEMENKMVEFEEIKEPVRKCLEIISKDTRYHLGDSPLNGKYFSAAIFNHYFKNPKKFPITRTEAQKMREYVYESGLNGRRYMDYIEVFYKEFPNFLERDSEDFLKSINDVRAKRGEKLIVLD